MIDTNIRQLPADEAMQRYLADVNRTLDVGQTADQLELNILKGIYGELGEIMNFDKKVDHNGFSDDPDHRQDEVGDFMFYFCAYLQRRGVDLIAALERNMRKRAVRFPNGYSHAAAQARVDKQVAYMCLDCGKDIRPADVSYTGPAAGEIYHGGCGPQAARRGKKPIGEDTGSSL